MIKRIVVFGCSYCTGEEILYHELGDELSDLHKSTAKDPRIFFEKIAQNDLMNDLKSIQKKQMQLAWPKKLADILGIECLNLAESGNSMQKMLWQFLDQYNRENLQQTDLILFAETKAERNLFFGDHPMSFQIATMNDPGLGKIIGVSSNGGVSTVIDENIDRAMMHWFNDDRMFWDHIMVLNCLSYWRNKLNLFVVPAMSMNQYETKDYNIDLFSTLYKEFRASDLYLTDLGLDYCAKSQNDYLPWGHPKEIVHDQYAELLSQLIYARIQN